VDGTQFLHYQSHSFKEFIMENHIRKAGLAEATAAKVLSVRTRVRRILGVLALGFAIPVIAAQPQTVAIQTADRLHFLNAVNGGVFADPNMVFPLDANRQNASTWETFTMTQVNASQVTFATSGGNWVTAVNGGGMVGPANTLAPIETNVTQVNTNSTFVITPVDNLGHVTIQTCNGDYLSANWGGGQTDDTAGFNTQPIHTDAVVANRPAGTWETFSLVPSACPPKPVTLNQVNITVATADQTGGAGQQSEVVAELQLNGNSSPIWMCLKPSSIATDPSRVCAVTANAPSWTTWSVPVNGMSFGLSSPITLLPGQQNIGTLQLHVYDWGGSGNTAIQGIKLTATGPSGTDTWFDDGSFHNFQPPNNGIYTITDCFMEIQGSGGSAAIILNDGAHALQTGPNNAC
jgi:hypothetical protein